MSDSAQHAASAPAEKRSLGARLLTFVLHRWFFVSRGMTLGVRAACFDAQGRIFLVRHSYVGGWHMPGGGVERGQTAQAALRRELLEEGCLEIVGEPEMLAVFFNARMSRRDHVVFYRCAVRQIREKMPDREIIEARFFAPDALPEGVTPATRRRIDELRDGAPHADFW
ncbi:NUDIX domain-containing protein [Pseudohoeflea coraliihabitans]|uniref:NUDIX domain-containing protein n=1 Tax=Pseudohoeflea coraliihabitans TaxID=2860393 RepID=A0ABS6WM34_9HYPH|nr:NUDIX domain-containing protein [Pseudohoeflea sp. DP4N28-3]MBW3096134.1 NUDIX domain-containing protein [Pseudohoeflea sp. DP4N28-3]